MSSLQTTRPAPPSPPKDPSRRSKWSAAVVATLVLAIGVALISFALMHTGRATTIDDLQGQTTAQTLTSANGAATIGTESTGSVTSLTTGMEYSSAVVMTDVSEIVSDVIDTVVIVHVSFDVRGPVDVTGSGSGVIVDESGTIVTNAHVVNGAASVTVELTDGTSYTASILTVDTSADVAVIQIDAADLRAIEPGTSEGLLVGNPVIAIGNPLGLEGGPSVSTGIVSALDRVLEEEDTVLSGIIQTDAAITQGSSGGALLNSNGQLIGITTAVGVSSVGVEGIAFAVPIETVNSVLATLG